MSEHKTADAKAYDPLESMRTMRDAYMNIMAKTMIDTVNTEAYASANGTLLENTLTMTAPMRDAFEKSMLQALQQLSLPSRDDVLGLASRFTNFEMRLDDLDASLSGLDTGSLKTLPAILEHLVTISSALAAMGRRMEALEAALQRKSQSTPSIESAAPLVQPAPAAHGSEANSAARRKLERQALRQARPAAGKGAK